jgi:hypothetical protein
MHVPTILVADLIIFAAVLLPSAVFLHFIRLPTSNSPRPPAAREAAKLASAHPAVAPAIGEPASPACLPEAQASTIVETASSGPPARARALAEPEEQPVLVICLADTPWGNAGDTLIGMLTELDDRQKVITIIDDVGATYTVSLHAPYVCVQELSHD